MTRQAGGGGGRGFTPEYLMFHRIISGRVIGFQLSWLHEHATQLASSFCEELTNLDVDRLLKVIELLDKQTVRSI